MQSSAHNTHIEACELHSKQISHNNTLRIRSSNSIVIMRQSRRLCQCVRNLMKWIIRYAHTVRIFSFKIQIRHIGITCWLCTCRLSAPSDHNWAYLLCIHPYILTTIREFLYSIQSIWWLLLIVNAQILMRWAMKSEMTCSDNRHTHIYHLDLKQVAIVGIMTWLDASGNNYDDDE